MSGRKETSPLEVLRQIRERQQKAGEISDIIGRGFDAFLDPEHAGEHAGKFVEGLVNLTMRALREGHAAPNGPTGPVVDADPNPPSTPQQ